MENSDIPQSNVVDLEAAKLKAAEANGSEHPNPAILPHPEESPKVDIPVAPKPAENEAPKAKELTEQEKVNQQIIQKATQDYVDLKQAVMNITNVHNVIAQGTHHGTNIRNAYDAQDFLTKMWQPLREQLNNHPMFKAEMAEAEKIRHDALINAAKIEQEKHAQSGAADGKEQTVQ